MNPIRPYDFVMCRAYADEYGKFKGFVWGNSRSDMTEQLIGKPYKCFGKTIIIKIGGKK